MRMTPAIKVILIINIVFYVFTYWITPAISLGGYTDWLFRFFRVSIHYLYVYAWRMVAFVL